jgi:aminoglycoside 2'-N-acetyltransferase I
MPPAGAVLRELRTADLTAPELAALRDLFSAAWPDGAFSDDDFAHAMGGMHWVAEVDGRIVSHAAMHPRSLEAGDRVLDAAYLEGVATLPAFERRGLGRSVAEAAAAYLRLRFQLGALSTSAPGFYERLGWLEWLGPTWVRLPSGELERTEDDDGGIFVLRTPTTPTLTLTESLVCDWRPGDVW